MSKRREGFFYMMTQLHKISSAFVPSSDGYSKGWGVYLMYKGTHRKSACVYTRCEDEMFCRAELLELVARLRTDPKFLQEPDRSIIGVYDVDPTYTEEEFIRSKRNKPNGSHEFEKYLREIEAKGWPYPLLVGENVLPSTGEDSGGTDDHSQHG